MAKPKPTPEYKAHQGAVRKAAIITPEHRALLRQNAEKARDARVQRMLDDGDELTNGQKLFLDEYAKCYDKNKAYRRAFPDSSVGSAYASSTAFLKNPKVKKYLDQIDIERAEAMNVTPKRITDELVKMGFANFDNYMVVDEVTGNRYIDIKHCTADELAGLSEIKQTRRVLRTRGGDEETEEVELTHLVKMSDKRGALELLGKLKGMFSSHPDGIDPATGQPYLPPSTEIHFLEPNNEDYDPNAATPAKATIESSH